MGREIRQVVIADFTAVLVQFNIAAFQWVPLAGNVLYLDWKLTY